MINDRKPYGPPTSAFQTLSEDAQLHILSFLHPEGQAMLLCASRAWYTLEANRSVSDWARYCQDYASNILGRGYFWEHLLDNPQNSQVCAFDRYVQHVFPDEDFRVHCREGRDRGVLRLNNLVKHYTKFKQILNRFFPELTNTHFYPTLKPKDLFNKIQTITRETKTLEIAFTTEYEFKCIGSPLHEFLLRSDALDAIKIIPEEKEEEDEDEEGEEKKKRDCIDLFKKIRTWLRQTEFIERVISDFLLTEYALLFQNTLIWDKRKALDKDGLIGKESARAQHCFAVAEAKKRLTPSTTRHQTTQSALMILSCSEETNDDGTLHINAHLEKAFLNPNSQLFNLLMPKLQGCDLVLLCKNRGALSLPEDTYRFILGEPAITHKFSTREAVESALALEHGLSPTHGDCDLHYIIKHNPHFIELMNQPISPNGTNGWVELAKEGGWLVLDFLTLPAEPSIINSISLSSQDITQMISLTCSWDNASLVFLDKRLLACLQGPFRDKLPGYLFLDIQEYYARSAGVEDEKATDILEIITPLLPPPKQIPQHRIVRIKQIEPIETKLKIRDEITSPEKTPPASPRKRSDSDIIANTSPIFERPLRYDTDHLLDETIDEVQHTSPSAPLVFACCVGALLCAAGGTSYLLSGNIPDWAFICLVLGAPTLLVSTGKLLSEFCNRNTCVDDSFADTTPPASPSYGATDSFFSREI